MCTRAIEDDTSQNTQITEEISELSHRLALANCDTLLDELVGKNESNVDSLRAAFVAYLDAFQNAFRTQIQLRFQQNQNNDNEPWFTDYVTLKPLLLGKKDEKTSSAEAHHSIGSFKAKAQKITKKACDLLQNSESSELSAKKKSNHAGNFRAWKNIQCFGQ